MDFPGADGRYTESGLVDLLHPGRLSAQAAAANLRMKVRREGAILSLLQ